MNQKITIQGITLEQIVTKIDRTNDKSLVMSLESIGAEILVEESEGDELATQKAKGPGKGWWGPPRGTHGAAHDLISGSFSDEQLQDIADAIDKVPAEHLEGLTGITSEIPDDELDYPLGWTNSMGGIYDPNDQTIHINPEFGDISNTFIHELGHHRTRILLDWHNYELKWKADEIHEFFERLGETWKDRHLAMIGLDRYTISNTVELFAGLYVAQWLGTNDQRSRLKTLLKDYNLDPNSIVPELIR